MIICDTHTHKYTYITYTMGYYSASKKKKKVNHGISKNMNEPGDLYVK